MTALLTCGGYAFIGGPVTSVKKFVPGVAAPLSWAVSEWTANPSSRVWPYVEMHGMVDRIITAQIQASSEALARAELAAIRSACQPGALLVWQPAGQAYPVSCTVLAADVDTPDFDPLTVKVAAKGFYIGCTVSIRTRPYWLGPEEQLTPTVYPTWATATAYVLGDTRFDGASHFYTCSTAHTSGVWATDLLTKWSACSVPAMSSGTPFVVFIPAVGGDVPALTRTRVTHAQATASIALGLRSKAAVGFSPLADYSGTEDTAAFGGSAAQGSMTTTSTMLGTAPTVDVAAMLGEYLILARAKVETATVAGAFFRFVSKVQGAVGGAFSTFGTEVKPVTASAAGFDVLNLGVAQLPAGRVGTGTAYEWTPETKTRELASPLRDSFGVFYTSAPGSNLQTITTTGQRVRLELLLGDANAGVACTAVVGLYSGTTLIASATVNIPAYSLSVWPPTVWTSTPAFEVPAGTYIVKAYGTSALAASVGTTSGGEYIRVYESSHVTVSNCALGVQVRNSTAETKYARLDDVALIPTDEAAVVVTLASAINEGAVIDYLTENDADHDFYCASRTDTGISAVSSVVPYGGPLMLRPGDNYLVGMADTPKAAAPGNAAVIITTRKRFLLPYAGV